MERHERARYSRHLVLPEVGEAGQERLRDSSVLVVGAGGLGSPALLYLAAAGVGRLGVADDDRVELSNLQRQVLHGTSGVGSLKVSSTADRLRDLNPHVAVEVIADRITSANAMSIVGRYDLVIDGSDNFPTRYLLNDACALARKPYVYGSVFRFEGQVAVFDARSGPCYRCLYPAPPPPELAPNCAEAGVLGVVPGVVGTLQAVECLKLLLGVGKPLIGRMVLFDALAMEFSELRLHKAADCPLCGAKPTVTHLIDYEAFCASSNPERNTAVIPEITVEELKQRMDRNDEFVLIDVREPEEHEFAQIGGTLIPMQELPERLASLDRSKETILYCRSGSRSASAVRFLQQNGFTNVKNLRGGILAWAKSIDPSVPMY